MTVLVPGIDSGDVVAGVAVKLMAILENIIKIESNSVVWGICTIPLGNNLSIEVVNWRVSLS